MVRLQQPETASVTLIEMRPTRSGSKTIGFVVGFSLLISALISPPLHGQTSILSGSFWLKHCQKSDMACIGYLQALLDTANMERENGLPVAWCAPSMLTLEELRTTIVKKLKSEPEKLSSPFISLATAALAISYPCMDEPIK